VLDTIYSLSGEVPAALGAGDGQDEGALREGALTSGSVKRACWVRKVSAGGAILHCTHEVSIGERLELELLNGERLAGRVVWQSGADIGLSFDMPVDVYAIIARDIVNQPGERRRMPRVEIVSQALLETAAGTELVTTRDISQGGIKVDVPFPLSPEQKVTVTLDGLHPVPGVVRWSQGNIVGIAFQPELGWQDLMLWIKEQRHVARAEAPARPAAPAAFDAPAALPPEIEEGIALNLPARVRDGNRRWSIDVTAITTRSVAFDSYAALRMGALLWIVLPGLEGWPARIVSVDGYRFNCEFTQPLHPAVLERILALAKEGAG
jgi:hypothetical protein